MKALEKIREISKTLAASGIDTAEKEAEFIVMQALDTDLVGLCSNNPEINAAQMLAIDEMAGRRSKREPLQYILGFTDFMGLRLKIGEGVLIPRPETELMAEYAIQKVRRQKAKDSSQGSVVRSQENYKYRILDLCTGSGCLALSLAREFPDADVYGTDISEMALGYAKENAQVNGIDNVSFINGHLFEPFAGEEDKNEFNFIISNPPYIRTDDIQTLQPEIREWEPLKALDGGPDGMDFYREIVSGSRKFLKNGGILMFELGAGCADDVSRMFADAGYNETEIQKDYAGMERIIQATWTR